jgi:hypothetical protein
MHHQASALAKLRPKVVHIASPDAYLSIFKHGLLSTASLLETLGWNADDIENLITQPRADFVSITDADGGHGARLSHQKPINLTMLRKCLDLTATSEADYFRYLATRVFLFPTTDAASGFNNALLLAGPIDILTINTFALLQSAGDRVEVSRSNSGSSPRTPTAKGRGTWVRLGEFDDRVSKVKEVTVLDRVDDVETITQSVVRVYGDGTRKRIWP